MSEDKMKTDIWNLGKLFKNQRQWVVPVYQRHYVWKSKDDDQIPGMWEDWQDKADEILSPDPSKPIRPHYFGAIIYSDRKKRVHEIDSIDKMELVDGQQRLTTFQLALTALRYSANAFRYNTKDIESYILNKNDGEILPDEEGYKLWPSRLDRDAFRLIVSSNGGTLDAESELTKAYRYFCKEITQFVKNRTALGEIETLIDALKEALLDKFQVVIIQLGKDDDPQQIFGSLNGQAEPLAPFDLIRNYVFSQARGEDREIDADFEEKWSYFEKSFWSEQRGRGRVRKARADHFIVDAVVAEAKKLVNQHRIAKEYKTVAEKTNLNDFQKLDVLIDYGKTYRAMAEQPDGRVTNRIANMLDVWDLSTMNPLVLWIDTRKNLNHEEKNKVFLMIENYIIRREVCNLTLKGFNKTVPAILNKMHKQKDNIVGVFKDFLEKEINDTTRMPINSDILLNCERQPIYKLLSASKLKYILQCIEERARDEFEEEITIKTDKLNIEHIMPQGWKEHWRIKTAAGHVKFSHEPDADLNLSSADQELVAGRENLIHTIGNLTLVTSKFNSSLKNSSWNIKRGKIEEKSRLGLNLAIVKKAEWDEDTIKARSKELGDYINEIWKHPSTE